MQKKAPLSTTTTTAPPLCLYTLRFLRCLGSGARGRSLKGREGLGLGRYTLQRGGGGGGGGGRGQKFQGKKCIAWQLRPGKKEEGKETMSRYALKVNARLREREMQSRFLPPLFPAYTVVHGTLLLLSSGTFCAHRRLRHREEGTMIPPTMILQCLLLLDPSAIY